MWSRTALRSSAPRTTLGPRRLAVVGVLTLAFAGPMAAAHAAPADITVPLTPAPRVGTIAETLPGAPHGFALSAGYGGSVTVHFPSLATPGPETEFSLTFDDGTVSNRALPGYHWYFSTQPSSSYVAPLSVTNLGGDAYRIAVPRLNQVDNLARSLTATLEVHNLTTTLPGGTGEPNGEGLNARLAVTVGGPGTSSLPTHLTVEAQLPRVGATIGGVVRLSLPTSSSLYLAGLTSLRDAAISLHRANAGNLEEDWGPAEPIRTSVSSNGEHATIAIPDTVTPGVYALEVRADQPHFFTATAFLVDLSQADPVAASDTATPSAPTTPSTAAAPIASTSAAATSQQIAAPGTVASGTTASPTLQMAGSGHPWIPWTGLGLVVLAVAGGAGFLLRRRASNR